MLEALALIASEPVDFDLRDHAPTETVTVEVIDPHAAPAARITLPELTPRQVDAFEQRRLAYHVLNIADLLTTAYCIEAVRGCYEANPVYGNSLARVVIGKAASAVIYDIVLEELLDSGRYRHAEIYQYVMIAAQGTVVTMNVRVVLF